MGVSIYQYYWLKVNNIKCDGNYRMNGFFLILDSTLRFVVDY